MKKTYANLSETLPSQQLKLTAKGITSMLFATALLIGMSLLILAPSKVFAQVPTISYSTPQTYTVGTAVTLGPTSSGVAAYGYSSGATTLASGFNLPMGLATDAAGNVYVADFGNKLLKKIPAGGGTPTTVGSGFTGPTGVAVDPAGNIWVTDSGDLKEVPAGGGAIVTTSIGDAVAVAVDSQGNVFVLATSEGFGSVTEYPVGGGTPIVKSEDDNSMDTGIAVDRLGDIFVSFQAPIPDINQVEEIGNGGGYNNLGAGLNAPTGVAVDGIGNVFVADAGFTGIVEYPVSGAAQLTVSSGLNGPNGVALDGAGNIYESDRGTNTVKEIKAVGGYFISPGLPAGLNLDETTGVISGTPAVVSPATNYTITAHNSSGSTSTTLNITVNSAPPLSTLANLVLSSGTLTPSFATGTTNYTAAVVNTVTSITVTPTTSSPTATVTVNGTTVASGSASPGIPLSVGSNAISVVVTAAGGVSTNTYTVNVTRVPPANTALSNIMLSTGTLSPAFAAATTSYVDSVSYSTSSITLTPTTSDPTSTVKVNGATVASGSPSAAIALTPGTNPVTVVVTASDGITTTTYTVFVTSPSVAFSYSSPHIYDIANTITPLSPTVSGTVAAPAYSSSFVTLATGFFGPTGVAVDAAGNVYVADQSNNAVKKIPAGGGSPVTIESGITDPFAIAVDATGNVYVCYYGTTGIKKIPAGGGTPIVIGSGFSRPSGVAVDGAGNIYIGDTGNNAVKEIPVSGGPIITLATGFTPYGVAVDAGGNVYAADYTNKEIKKIPAGGGTPVIVNTVASNPMGLAVDASGNLFVGYPYINKVTKIPAGGGATVSIGSGFNGPVGVAVDRKGNVYVADEDNNAVEKIKPVGGYYIGPFLPAGLSFNNTTGIISGTPTALSPATNYFVTAYNSSGSGSATVNIAVEKIGLSGLTLSSGLLSPTFATGTTSYTAAVPAGTTSITETPTSLNPSSNITVNGTTVASGTASASIPLSVGPNTITTVVTAAGGTGTKTYTVIAGRGSADALLTSIHLTPATSLTIVSGPSYVNYTAQVPAATSSITVTATEQDATATITVNGTPVASGTASPSIPLSIGINVINIVSTAQNGVTTKTYTINLARGSSDALLTSMHLTPTSPLTIVSGPSYVNYTTSVPHSETSVTVTSTVQDATATIAVNGTTVASGVASPSIPLNVGSNVINIVVTAQNGVTTKTYTITATRGPSSDALLTSIRLAPAASLTIVSGPSYVNYTTSYANSVSSCTVTATEQDLTATITVNGTTVASGVASPPIPLTVGSGNVINIVSTAQDGTTTKTYTITVTRNAPGMENSLDQSISVTKPTTIVPIESDGIVVHEGVSPNGDGINDVFTIEGLATYPQNKVSVIDRNGVLIYQANSYDNQATAFDGHSNINGRMQLPGTYFYTLDYSVNGQNKHKTGYIILKY